MLTPDNLDCPSVRELIGLMIKEDPSLGDDLRQAAEEHIASCDACRAELVEEFQLVDFLRTHWGQVSPDTGRHVADHERADDVCGAELVAAVAGEGRNLTRRTIVLGALRMSAVAAGLLLAIGVAWRAYVGVPRDGDGRVAVGQSRALAQIISRAGPKDLALGREFTSGPEPTEILLGGMHRVVMNAGAAATFNAAGETFDIDLRSGELYVEVVKGHPFEVKTGNARISVMGTRFDVAAQEGRTDLVMLEGKVLFAGADSGAIELAAGYASSARGNCAPDRPRPVDALAATAWARTCALANAVAQAGATTCADVSDTLLDSPISPAPEKTDYRQWRQSHREWFSREFPWIFAMQRVLKDRYAIEADYVELLAVSGDIWQFRYARPWNQPMAVFDPSSVTRVCEHYRIDRQIMTDALAAFASPAVSRPADANISATELFAGYRTALGLWHADLSSRAQAGLDMPSELLLFSLRAGNFLAQTRTAAWLWLRELPDDDVASLPQWQLFAGAGRAEAPGLSRREWLDRLSGEMEAAGKVDSAVRELLVLPKVSDCQAKEATLAAELREAAGGLLPTPQSN